MIYNCFCTIIKSKTKVFRSKVLPGFQAGRSVFASQNQSLASKNHSPPLLAKQSSAYNLSKHNFTTLSLYSRSGRLNSVQGKETRGYLVGQAPPQLFSSLTSSTPPPVTNLPVTKEKLGQGLIYPYGLFNPELCSCSCCLSYAQATAVVRAIDSVRANVGVFPVCASLNGVQVKTGAQLGLKRSSYRSEASVQLRSCTNGVCASSTNKVCPAQLRSCPAQTVHLNRVQVAKFVQASKQSSSSYAFALHKQSLCKQAKTSFVQARTRSTLTLFGKVRSYRVLSFAFKFCCLPRPTLHKRRRVSLCSSSKTLRALGSQVQLRCTNFAPEQGSGCTVCARTRARFERTHVSFALANHLRWHSKWLTRSNRVLGQELNRFLNPLSHNSDPLVGESSIRPSVSFSHGNSVQVNLNKVQTKAQAKGAKDRNPVPIFRSTKSKYQSTIPDFVKIQRKSFVLFLQKGFLDEVLKRYPLTNPKGDLELSFYPEYYKLARPDYSSQKSILKSKTYASKLYIPVQLTNKKNQKINVQWVLLGHLVRFV